LKTWLLSGLLLALLAFNFMPMGSRSERAYRFLVEMDPGPAVRSFTSTDLLPGSMAEQVPPPGSVSRDYRPLPFDASSDDAERAGRELHNPIQNSPEAVASGRKLFRTFCIPCHGAEGLGDGTIVSRGFPAPPSLSAEHARNLPDGRIFHILSFGQANMPPYRVQLTPTERWTVIHFVRELQSGGKPK
jgi:mono/diheme cytochrome c family protein